MAAAGAALACAALTALGTAAWVGHTPEASAAVSAMPPPAVREFHLVAQEVEWEVFPGTRVRAWTYGGTMPGPEIRVNEGDTVRVTLENRLPQPTTIHWHGIDVPNAMDGVPGMTQAAVQPGETFIYEFPATNPGTRWYHTHQDSEFQTPLGLFGPIIVNPRTPPVGEPVYDREYTYTLSEWSLALTPEVAKGEASLPQSGPGSPHAKQLDFDFFLINGKAHDSIAPIVMKQGERIRVRLINAGALPHTIHSHGHSFKVVATDGNPVPPGAQLTKDSVTIGPSERVDLEILATNPGVWMFHCHMQHHAANGMMTTIRYEGVPAPVGDGTHAGHVQTAPPSSSSPAPAALSPDDPAVLGAAARIVMTDNRYQPASITIPVGSTVAWINNGTNLHTASSFDGSFETGSIASAKAATLTFQNPGQYQYFCRQHLLNGMTGTVIVQ